MKVRLAHRIGMAAAVLSACALAASAAAIATGNYSAWAAVPLAISFTASVVWFFSGHPYEDWERYVPEAGENEESR